MLYTLKYLSKVCSLNFKTSINIINLAIKFAVYIELKLPCPFRPLTKIFTSGHFENVHCLEKKKKETAKKKYQGCQRPMPSNDIVCKPGLYYYSLVCYFK